MAGIQGVRVSPKLSQKSCRNVSFYIKKDGHVN